MSEKYSSDVYFDSGSHKVDIGYLNWINRIIITIRDENGDVAKSKTFTPDNCKCPDEIDIKKEIDSMIHELKYAIGKEKMTIDDLISKIEGLKRPPQFKDAFSWGLNEAIKIVRDNKEALERGMQKPLRFKKFKGDTRYFLLDKNGTLLPILVMGSEESCKLLAEDLGLPCEFIEDGK